MLFVHILIGVAIGTVLAQVADPGSEPTLVKGIVTLGSMAAWLYFVEERRRARIAEQEKRDLAELKAMRTDDDDEIA